MKSPSSRWAVTLVPLLLLFTASCANPINLKTAEKYYDAGLHASASGDHYAAAVYYSRAYGNARIGGAPDAGLAMASYAYGRELALLGEFEEAVELLEESLKFERRSEPVDTGNMLRRVSVLGRIFLDTNRPAEALPHFREADDLARAMEPGAVPPGDMMYHLRDLEKATAAAGTAAELEVIRAELKTLLDEHGDEGPSAHYFRFTPEDVRLRIAADTSPAKWKPE